MPTCFVIQPFSPRFDKRYDEDYKPALEEAGLEPYRVDQDPSTEKVMDSIEKEIRKATICLADITTDNPNVWYELGYAFAVGRSVIMVCSKERDGKKYPFDIQHRTIIEYASESRSDFDKLRDEITKRAKALVKKITEQPVSEAQQVVPTQDLNAEEISVITIAASEATIPKSAVDAWTLRQEAIRTGVTKLGCTLAIRSLKRRGFVEIREGDNENGDYYQNITVTDSAWTYIHSNRSLFSLSKRRGKEDNVPLTEDDIPF